MSEVDPGRTLVKFQVLVSKYPRHTQCISPETGSFDSKYLLVHWTGEGYPHQTRIGIRQKLEFVMN